MRFWRAHILAAFLGIGLSLAATSPFVWAEDPQVQDGDSAGVVGPDVIVSGFPGSMVSYAYQNTLTGFITGLAIGTQSCNVGDDPLLWQELPSVKHPVIRSSMYRLKNSRFEQIGMSWVKHGFYATNDTDCDLICTAPGNHNGASLYPGCSDPYGAYLNGERGYLGPTLPINAHTGTFSGPVVHPAPTGQNGRLQVHNVDLDPTFNANARYYIGAQYIAADDAAAHNGNNNASYQRAFVVSATTSPTDSCTDDDPQRFCVYPTDFIHDTESPIRAWKSWDPGVVETDAQVPNEGLFILAARVVELGNGFWRYEYALQNLNSDRSGKAFTVPIAIGSAVNNIGFHDVEYHSGEPIDNTDWQATLLSGKIIWSTQDYSVNPNANALRWGTLYNFRFDSSAPPGGTSVTLDLFKPGAPDKININTVGPVVGCVDCNQNGIGDACDVNCNNVNCAEEGCSQPCGVSIDCNDNSVPDECETDCNENGIADTCDLVPQGSSPDCNENTVPDECEEDCNLDGIPDNCQFIPDSDGDGWNDCVDLCPFTTPPNGCAPPTVACCLSRSGISIQNYPYQTCLSDRGTPLCDAEFPGSCQSDPPACPTTFCHLGCLVGDGDGDGDFDLADFSALLPCFTGNGIPPIPPPFTCRTYFDYDENNAINYADVENFRKDLAGPAPN